MARATADAIAPHQHDQRKNQRQPGQRLWSHAADEMRVDRRGHRNQHDIDDDVRRGEAQQRRHDWAFEEKTGAGSSRWFGNGGCACGLND
jgi:hypothetical protein